MQLQTTNTGTNRSPADDVLKDREAAEYTGCSVSTLAKRRMTGDGPRFIKIGRSIRYRRGDLDAWLASHMRNSTTEYSRG